MTYKKVGGCGKIKVQLPERERPHLDGEYEANPFIPLSAGGTYEDTQ